MVQNVPDSTYSQYTYSNKELDAYKALAKKNGTYYKGTVAFNASNKMPNGIVYINGGTGKCTHFFLALGEGDRIPAWIAGWAPAIVFGTIGLYLLQLRTSNRDPSDFRWLLPRRILAR